MPLHIVDAATDVEGLTRQLLKSRLSRAARERAIRAIRAANPGLDLDRLTPGTVVVVPALADARRKGGVVEESIASVLDSVAAALDATEAAADGALEAGRAEREQARGVFSSAEVKRAAVKDEDLKRILAELKGALEEDERTATQQTEDVHAARRGWSEDLEALRRLIEATE